MSDIIQEAEANTNPEEEILENSDEQLDTSVFNTGEKSIYPMKSVKVEKGFFTAYELKRKHDKKPSLVLLDSDFQREEVWKLQQKRELIESILMGLPLPIFYFNEDKTGKLIVIDGRQRLSAIFSFLNNEFALDNLKILDEFNKKRFRDLEPVYQSKIEDYQIMAHVIQPMTPDRVKFDIFDRVNRSGTKLNKQEIRNALYQGEATKLLNRLSMTEAFNTATDNSFLKDKRMKNRYLLSRFIAFDLYYDRKLYKNNSAQKVLYQYNGDIDELLGLAMDYLNYSPQEEVDRIERMTVRALEQICYYFDGNAFRLIDKDDEGNMIKRYPININIFETLMLGMVMLPYKESAIRQALRKKIDALKQDPVFRDSLNNHRDSENKVSFRYQRIKEIVGELT